MNKPTTIITLCYLFSGVLLSMTSSCQGDDPPLLLPETITIELDFSDPNNTSSNVGYRYYFQGGDYPADYASWVEWNCSAGPDFFGAWNDVETVAWLGTCLPINTSSIQLLVADQIFVPESISLVQDAHENTYQLALPADAKRLIRIPDFQDGVTGITINFTQE